MEQRAMETALGCRIKREIVSGEGNILKYVDFTLIGEK